MRLSELLQPPDAPANDTGSMRLSDLMSPQQEQPSSNSLQLDRQQFDAPGRLDAQPLESDTFQGFAATSRNYSVPDLQRQTAPTPDQITQGLLPTDQEHQQQEQRDFHYRTQYNRVDDWIYSLPDYIPGESGEHEYRTYLHTHPFPQDAFQQLGPNHQQELLQKFHIKDQGQLPQLTAYQSAGAGMGEGYQGLKKAAAGLQEIGEYVQPTPNNGAQQQVAPGQDLRDSANIELERLSRVQSEPGAPETARAVARAGTNLIPAAVSGPAAPVVMGLQSAGQAMEQTRDVMLQNGINPDDYRGRRILNAVVQGVISGAAMSAGGPGIEGAAKLGLGMGIADFAQQLGQKATTGVGEIDPAQSMKAVIEGLVLHYATHAEEIPGVSAAAGKLADAGAKIGQKAARVATGSRYRPGGGGKWNPVQGEVVDWGDNQTSPPEDIYADVQPIPPEQMRSDVANRGNRLPDKPLTSYSVAELRDIASAEGIGIPKTLKKADIVEAIERAQRERAPTQTGEPTNEPIPAAREPVVPAAGSGQPSSLGSGDRPQEVRSTEIPSDVGGGPEEGSRPAGQEQTTEKSLVVGDRVESIGGSGTVIGIDNGLVKIKIDEPRPGQPTEQQFALKYVRPEPQLEIKYNPNKPSSYAQAVAGKGDVYLGTVADLLSKNHPAYPELSKSAGSTPVFVSDFEAGSPNPARHLRNRSTGVEIIQFRRHDPIEPRIFDAVLAHEAVHSARGRKGRPLGQEYRDIAEESAQRASMSGIRRQTTQAAARIDLQRSAGPAVENAPEVPQKPVSEPPQGYDEALKVVESAGLANIPLLQRKLGIGYHQAKEILDRLQVDGKVPTKEAGKQATKIKLSRKGFVALPNFGELRAGIRDLRERYAKVEEDSPRLAYGLTLSQQPNAQAESMIAHFEKQAFGGDEQLRQNFYDLGMHYRGDVLNMQGKPATGVPRLSPQSLQMITSHPRIQRAIDLWNRDIAPVISDIRTRHGLPMSKNAGKVPFFFNLPSELEPTAMDKQAINAGLAFSKTASGEGDYMKDPHEGMISMLRGHLRTDASQIVRDEIRKISIDRGTVIDPSGKKNPAAFESPTKGQPFQAKYKGKMIDVGVVDLNKDQVDPVYYPGTNRIWWYPPELHYVPMRVADAWDNLKQDMEKQDTLLDKTIHGFTRVALVGDLAPHSLRVLFHVAGRLGQAGNVGTVIPWYGSIPATVVRMMQMKDSQLGQATQILIDRSGSNRGSGYNLRPVKNDLLKYADIPHQLLMNANYGVDPMARRAVANAYLYEEIGQDFMDKLEDRLNKNIISPAAYAAAVQAKLKSKGMLGLGRRVNSTLGFSNRQTRKELLNKVQRFLPFLSSQSGMIPGEIRKLLTLNLNPKAVGKAIKRGEYLRALLMVGGALATGAAGTYLMSQGLNRAATGHDMEDNDERHKADVALGNGWYVSNIDPTFDRATREMGLKAQVNRESASLPKDVGREMANEAMATVNPAFRMAFSLATGKAMYLKEDNQFADVRDGWWWPMGAGRGAMSATKEKRGEGFIKDIVQSTTGLRVSKSEGKNYTHAERLATELLAKDSRGLSPEERERREARNYAVESIRKNPNVQIGPETGIPEEQFKEVYKESHMLPVVYKLQHLSVPDAMLVWAKMNDQEKQQAQPILLEKLTNKRTIFKDQDERAGLIEQVSSFK